MGQLGRSCPQRRHCRIYAAKRLRCFVARTSIHPAPTNWAAPRVMTTRACTLSPSAPPASTPGNGQKSAHFSIGAHLETHHLKAHLWVCPHPVDLLARHGKTVEALAHKSIGDRDDVRPVVLAASKTSQVSGLDHAVGSVTGQFLGEHHLPSQDVDLRVQAKSPKGGCALTSLKDR